MTIHSAKDFVIHVAPMDAPLDAVALQQIFLRRFVLRAEDEIAQHYAEHSWQIHSDVTRQSGLIEAEIAYAVDGAAQIIRNAALQAQSLIMKLFFPDGATLEGAFTIRDCEIYAEAGDVLKLAFTAHSRDALVLDLS